MISKKVSMKLKTVNTRRLTLRVLTPKDYQAWFDGYITSQKQSHLLKLKIRTEHYRSLLAKHDLDFESR